MSHQHDDLRNHYVRCLECEKVINCSQYGIECIMKHIYDEHSQLQVVDESGNTSVHISESERIETERGKRRAYKKVATSIPVIPRIVSGQTNDGFIRNNNEMCSEVPGVPKHLVFTPLRNVSIDFVDDLPNDPALGQPTPMRLFRTSVEQYRPAGGCLFCPNCHACKRPTVHIRHQHFSRNPYLANCFMFCWPCWFLLAKTTDTRNFLYCANCKTFLGIYNEKTNCFNPSREFLECEEKAKRKAAARTSEKFEDSQKTNGKKGRRTRDKK